MAPRLDDSTFGSFRELLRAAVGVWVHPDARIEFERHLVARMESLQLAGPDQYLAALRAGSDEELQDLIDAVVPHETASLRTERAPVEFLRSWLGERDAARIWCAGWGGGDEIDVVRELAAETGTAVEIVATDVNASLVEQAAPTHGVRFARHNLLEPFSPPETVDAVLLRYVLSEFDVAIRATVLEHVHAALRRDGVLLLGERESLLHVEHRFRYLRPAVFLRTMAGTRTNS